MPQNNQSGSASAPKSSLFLVFLGCLVLVLVALFYPSFNPRNVIFSNDNPLGALSATWLRPPKAFSGLWLDLNTIGYNNGKMPVSPSYLALWVLGSLIYSKFFV